MPSLEELTARCEHIGRELRTRDLSRHQLIDHATALTMLAAGMQRLTEEGHAVEGHALARSPADAEWTQEVNAAGVILQEVAVRIRTAGRDEVRATLLDAQAQLRTACHRLAATGE